MTRTLLLLGRLLWTKPAARPTDRVRRATRGRARRCVLAGVAFVVLFHVGMNLALDTIKPEWRDPEYGHRLKRLRPLARAANGRPVVVAVGSSRTQMGFSPEYLGLGDGPDSPVVFNFAVAGGGPVHEILNLKRLLDQGIKPDYLLIEVLPPVLAGHSTAEQLMLPARLGYADLARLERYTDSPDKLRDEWIKARVEPFHTLRLYLVSHLYGGLLHWKSRQDFLWKQMKPRGWMPYFFTDIPPEKRVQGTAEVHAQFVNYFPNFHIAPIPDRAYRDLLTLCRERGIRAAFYTMPESPTFRSWYPPGAMALVRQYLNGLSKEYGVPVFDASEWALSATTTPDLAIGGGGVGGLRSRLLSEEQRFADSHHMLRHAAKAFSARFGRECVGPWLRGELRP